MNIAVINIKDIIKFVLILGLLVIVVIFGITIVKANEKEDEAVSESGKEKESSFLYCLELELPIMAEDKEEEENEYSSTKKLLDTQLAMLYNVDEGTEEVTNQETSEEPKEEKKEEPETKKIEVAENVSTKVIEENNITPSFTDENSDIQVKNQSNYDVKDLIANANYQIKNKDKVVIYHTHTCESYTSSEKYPYEMTGAYRTTDLNYTVAKVRRWIRRMLKAIWKNSSTW